MEFGLSTRLQRVFHGSSLNDAQTRGGESKSFQQRIFDKWLSFKSMHRLGFQTSNPFLVGQQE